MDESTDKPSRLPLLAVYAKAPMFLQPRRESVFRIETSPFLREGRDNLLDFELLDEILHGTGSGVQVPVYKRKCKVSFTDSHARIKRNHFNEKSLVNRPTFFTLPMLDRDMTLRGKEIVDFSTRITTPKSQPHNVTPLSIVCYNKKIRGLRHQLSPVYVPPSSVKVQWRLTKVNRVPTFQLVFMMLNRVSPVTALTRLDSNSALCVFTTISGASRAMSVWKCEQATRLLILSWWHPENDLLSHRNEIDYSELKSSAWLTQEMRHLNTGGRYGEYMHLPAPTTTLRGQLHSDSSSTIESVGSSLKGALPKRRLTTPRFTLLDEYY